MCCREGFMHLLVAFAKPFRMPDFFMISGLFLGIVVGRDWRTYLDRKVVHFAYFYVSSGSPSSSRSRHWA